MKTKIILYFLAGTLAATTGYLAIKNIFGGSPRGITFPQLAATSSAGTIPAEFSIDANGGATYKIDIEVPPGTNGVQPGLSLTYNNQQQNGALGMGWSLNGMPSIQRVGKTIAQDGIKGGVQLSSTDRFAIGGQRLIAYRNSQGTILTTTAQRDAAYGQNGTEYHTEIESWTRFFSYGNCGGGPCYFLSYAKDGSVTQYGYTDDSKQKSASGGVVIEWGVNKSSDHNGNSVVVNYNSPSGNCWYYPVSVYYTGNNNTNLPAQRAVVFNYQPRNDLITSYVGGQVITINNRLASIQTFLDQDGDGKNVTATSNLVRQYNLTYGSYSAATNASLLTQMQECDAKNNCLNPTTFSYGRDKNLTNVLNAGSYNAGMGMDNVSASLLSGDFNGDGLTDMMRQSNEGTTNTIWVMFSNGSGGFNNTSFNSSDPLDVTSANLLPADYNGDGLTDFMVQSKTDYTSAVIIYYSNGNGTFNRQLYNSPSEQLDITNANLIPGDFNGDGRTDFMNQTRATYTSNFTIYYFTGGSTAFSTQQYNATTNIDATSAVLITGDFNGDGKADFMNQSVTPSNQLQVYWFDANGNLQNNITQGSGSPIDIVSANIVLGDFNGDGKTDFVRQSREQTSNQVQVYASNGAGDFVPTTITLPDPVDFTSVVLTTGDFNSDGLTDLLNQSKSTYTSAYIIYYSQSGTAFNKQSYTASGNIDYTSSGLMLGDYNGDAVTDMITQSNGGTTTTVGVYTSIVSAPALVTAFLDGLGKYTTALYAPLTNKTIYTKGSGAVYPYMNVQSSLWVTYQYNVMNSQTNATSNFTYSLIYQDGQMNLQRGWSGFRVTLLSDLQNNATSITTRLTPFPYSGVVAVQKTVDITDTTSCLGITNSTYQSTTMPGGAVYSIYNTQYQVQNYTSGTYNFTLTKTYRYDALGMNILEEDNLGDAGDPNDNQYIGVNYTYYNDTSQNWWKSFYPIARKVCSAQSGVNNWSSWNPATDLEWKQFAYDGQMNLTSSQLFMNTSGGINPVTNTWLTLGSVYDAYGNVIQKTSTDTTAWQTVYDSTYHTFAVLQISPQPATGLAALTTSASFDPRFGVRTANIDPNGNNLFNIPDGGMDGLGSILIAQTTNPTTNDLVTMNQSRFMPNPEGNGMMVQTYTRSGWDESDTSKWVWNNEYWDALGRHYQTSFKGYKPGVIRNEKVGYDNRGYATQEYTAYFSGAGIQYSENGQNYGSPVYFIHNFDRHGRPNQVFAPDPANPSSHYLVRQVDYQLHDSRKIVYTTPSAKGNGQYVKWTANLNTQGRTLTKSGPYDTLMNRLPETGTTTYVYDKLGQLVSITDPLGQVTSIVYNSVGQEIQHTRPESGTTLFSYNSQMQVAWQKDAKGQVTNFTYDKLGRMVSQQVYSGTNSLYKTTTNVYDLDSVPNGKGQLCLQITPEITRAYQYNNNGLVAEQQVSIRSLDADKNGTPDLYITRYLYDAMGRLSQVTNPDRSVVQYNSNRYDANLAFISESGDSVAGFGNYTSSGISGNVAYANEVISQYQYDFLGRMDTMQIQRRAYVQRFMSYTWTQANKLTNINDIRPAQFKDLVNLSETFVFDNAGRLTTATGPYSYTDSASSVTNTYQYDLGGNRTNYTQRVNGQNPSSYAISYNTAVKNQISSINYSNGTVSNYVFDACGDLQSIGTGNTRAGYRFAPDGTLAAVSMSAGDSTTFNYDGSGKRIIKTSHDSTTYYITELYEAVIAGTNSCVYTRYIGGPRGAIQAKSQQAANVALLSATDKLGKEFLLPAAFITPTDFHFFSGQIWIAGAAILFVMLALAGTIRSLRMRHKVQQHKKYRRYSLFSLVFFKKIAYIHKHHWLLANWYRPWVTALLIAAMLIVDAQPVKAQYAPGGGYPEQGQTLYFSYDHLGSNIIATDATGEQATTVVYKPYGSVASEEGHDNFRPKYTGKEIDESTGLYYFGARYYNSELGQFISPDPAMQYNSPYLYGNDDPTNGTDPNGEFFVVLAVLIVAGIIGAYAGASIANGTANPLKWDWTAGKTWAGIVGGAAIGVALAAGAVAGLAALGAITAAAATIGGATAGSIAFVAVDVAFLTYDAYQFSRDPSIENGIFVALDLIPFVGALLGRAVKGVRALARGAEFVGREAEAGAHAEQAALREERTVDEVVETCPLSFDGATEVLTAKGLTAISELQTGDEVWAYDEQTGKQKLYPVRMTFRRMAGAMVLIRAGNDTLQATPEHPFFIKGKGWVEARNIREQDELLKADKTTEKVQWTQTILDSRMVYNLSVAGAHTFYVSGDSVLSHNVLAACLQAKGKTRPSWRGSVKVTLYHEQEVTTGWVKSTVSNEMYPITKKILVGSRMQTIWDIDHIIPYKYLLEAAEEAKTSVTWEMMRNISNDTYNLELITHAENISHAFEPTGQFAKDGARAVLMRHGVKF